MKAKRVIFMVLIALASAVAAQVPDDLIAQGRALYFGTQPFASAPNIGGAALPLSSAACVSCHGALGAGSREGAQAASDIRAPALQSPLAWVHASLHGKRRDGAAVNTAMPRYALTPQEQAALIAYAPVLGSAKDVVRGVTDNEILLGVVSDIQHNMESNDEILNGVQHVFARVNAQGGVHGRQLRAVAVSTLAGADSVFALVGKLVGDRSKATDEEAAFAAQRLPNLASLSLSLEPVGAGTWTLPLLPSLRAQAVMLSRTLMEQSAAYHCEPWLLDATQLASPTTATRFSSVDQALAAKPATSVCVGLIATPAMSEALLRGLQSQGVRVPLIISLAALGPVSSSLKATRWQVFPAPVAIAAHAEMSGQTLWRSLGEAAAQTVVEALARSGRLLQPELVLAKMRELTGYEPVAGAAVAWSRTQSYGWSPVAWPMVEPTPTNSLSTTSMSPSRVATRHTPDLQGEKK